MEFNFTVEKNVEADIDSKLCINCGKCRQVCPTGAIGEYQKTVYCMFPDCGDGKGSECEAKYFKEARELATRYSCTYGCPLGIVPQAVASLVKAGDKETAVRMIKEKNPMPGVCGAVCSGNCEDFCKRGIMIDSPVDIRALENHVLADAEIRPYRYIQKYDEKIAVIGSGPAGLAAAHRLAVCGYKVTIFEKDRMPGGALKWGTPTFRLERKKLFEDIERILDAGVEIRYGCLVGADVSLEEIWAEGFRACIIAVGASRGVINDIPGADSGMVYDGVRLLRQINGGEEEGLKIGSDVIVTGSGELAESAARMLKRTGRNVICTSAARPDDLKISQDRITALENEGIEFMTLTAPKQIIREQGRVKAVEFIKMEYVEDDLGRMKPYIIKGSEFNVFCDTVIFADERRCSVEKICNVETYPDGMVRADSYGRTNKNMVFACGDAVMQCGSVAEAMASGNTAAVEIDRALHGTGLPVKEHTVKNASDAAIIYPSQVLNIIPQKERVIKEGSNGMSGFSCDISSVLKEAGIDEDLPVFAKKDENGIDRRKIAVIGGGLAGITAAIDLAKKGYAPVIFEREPGLGGKYRWLSSEKRLDKMLLKTELERITDSGIEVICNINAGVSPDIKSLMSEGYEAVLFATGETKGALPSGIDGRCRGVFEIVSLMPRLIGNEDIEGIGRQIIVTGCDEMVFDAARILRQRGGNVTVLSPVGKRGMRNEVGAIAAALDEGVNLVTGVEMTGIRSAKGHLKGINCRIVEKDMNMEVSCDTVIIGGTEMPDLYAVSKANPELEISEKGYIETDNKLVTSMYGVFAIGDLDMSSVDAGYAGAATIDSFMKSEDIKTVISKKEYVNDDRDAPKYEIFEGVVPDSGSFETGHEVLDSCQAFMEASRCMRCGYHMQQQAQCMGCGICIEVCPVNAIVLKRLKKHDAGNAKIKGQKEVQQ